MSRISTLLSAALLLAAPIALAQSAAGAAPELQPLSSTRLADALARPLGAAVSAPRTRGTLDLKDKRFYIAEYRVLIDQAGELPVAPRDGRLLGLQLAGDSVRLSYRSQPDIAALQTLVDRGWADLLLRLAAVGVNPTTPEQIISAHGAIFEATEPGSSQAAPLTVEAKTGETTRRYLVLAPTGGKLVHQMPGGLDIGNLAARLSYPRHQVEALSLTLAVNLSALDNSSQRRSGYALAPGVEALSPQMELGPAPAAALVHAHAQRALVNLNEALLLAPEFGRLRLASAAEAVKPSSPLQALISLGKSMTSGQQTTLETVLELDGPATARLLMYSLQAANQAIANTLQAALEP